MAKKGFILAPLSLVVFCAGFFIFLYFYNKNYPKNIAYNKDTRQQVSRVLESNYEILKSHLITKYLYLDKDGNYKVGYLSNGEEFVVMREDDRPWGGAYSLTVSPSGKYLAYLKLPENTLSELEKNPPHEFYGADNLELWLVNISDLENPTEKKISNDVPLFLGHRVITWNRASTGFYFPKSTDYGADSYSDLFYFELDTGQIQKTSTDIYDTGFFSPSGTRYLSLKFLDDVPDSVEYKFELDLNSLEGHFIKKVYEDIAFTDRNDINMNFIAEELIIFTTVDINYSEETKKSEPICSINLLNLKSNKIVNIEKRACNLGNDGAGFKFLSISPDGQKILAIISEHIWDNWDSSIFTYDTKSSKKSYLATQNLWYDQFYWISQDQIIALVEGQSVYSDKPQAFLIDISDGTFVTYKLIDGKNVIKMF